MSRSLNRHALTALLALGLLSLPAALHAGQSAAASPGFFARLFQRLGFSHPAVVTNPPPPAGPGVCMPSGIVPC